jgi:hypothetical protein
MAGRKNSVEDFLFRYILILLPHYPTLLHYLIK